MRKLNVLAASAACLLVPVPNATAATVQLESRVFDGINFTYSYGGTLAPTEGIVAGTKLVILDFAGYVEGSIFSPYAGIVGTTELTSSGILIDPLFTDDPTIANLVFTYTGADFQATPPADGETYTPIDFSGLSAASTFGETALAGFAAVTVKNASAPPSTVYSAGLFGRFRAGTRAGRARAGDMGHAPAGLRRRRYGFAARPRQTISFS